MSARASQIRVPIIPIYMNLYISDPSTEGTIWTFNISTDKVNECSCVADTTN